LFITINVIFSFHRCCEDVEPQFNWIGNWWRYGWTSKTCFRKSWGWGVI